MRAFQASCRRHYELLYQASRSTLRVGGRKGRPYTALQAARSRPQRQRFGACAPVGSVSPFGLINDRHHAVRVALDRDLRSAGRLSFHPNINTVTFTITAADFSRFLEACGNSVRYVSV